jgi:hypothetical protein
MEYGTALIHLGLLEKLSLLWEGPLRPEDLGDIEIALRAFIAGKHLGVLPVFWPGDSSYADSHVYDPHTRAFETPFDDHLLDYEFFNSRGLQRAALNKDEFDSLTDTVEKLLERKFRAEMPQNFSSEGDAIRFADEWYGAYTLLDYDDEAFRVPYDENEFFSLHQIFHYGPRDDAKLIVELTRQGYHIYGKAPIFDICGEHLFSIWPDRIFTDLEQEYREFARSLRGPGTGLELPPLTALLLSRSDSRPEIPATLVAIRDEFESFRSELWEILSEMWKAHSLQTQRKILSKLKPLGKSIFQASFEKNFDALSLGMELAKVSPAGIIGAMEKSRQQGAPRLQLRAVSFAQKLSSDFIKYMMTNRSLLKRHLSESERRSFGML